MNDSQNHTERKLEKCLALYALFNHQTYGNEIEKRALSC